MRLKIFLGVIASLLLASLYWLSTHAYIEFTVADAASTYSITNQKSDTAISGKAGGKTVKKLVAKGNYELAVHTGKSSFVTVVPVGGFMETHHVDTQVKPDNQRTFIGDDPNTCMYPVGENLLSAPCNDNFDQLKVHLPASTGSPTITQKGAGTITGLIEGSFRVGQGTYIVVKGAASEGKTGAHTLYQLNVDGTVGSPRQLNELSEGSDYTITPYLSGFVALDIANGKAFSFDSITAAGTGTSPNEAPKNSKLTLAGVSAYKTTIGFIYTDNPNIAPTSFDNTEGAKAHSGQYETASTGTTVPQTEIILQKGGSTRHYSFRVPAVGVYLCADDRLCTLNDGRLEVFDISKPKAKKLYELTGVKDVKVTSSQVLLARETDVLSFNILAGKGYASYSFGSYAYCGLEPMPTGYVLCAVNEHGKRVALLVNQTLPNTDDIDQKILTLSNAPSVSSISIYKNFINILPDVGGPEVNDQTGYYQYDPVKIQAANADIALQITKLGINRSAYTISSALQ